MKPFIMLLYCSSLTNAQQYQTEKQLQLKHAHAHGIFTKPAEFPANDTKNLLGQCPSRSNSPKVTINYATSRINIELKEEGFSYRVRLLNRQNFVVKDLYIARKQTSASFCTKGFARGDYKLLITSADHHVIECMALVIN